MAERVFALPDLGEGLEDAEIAGWLVKEGEEVALNQPLVEVETAKATVEIPSPFAGVVAKLHAAPGETLKVGAPLVTFEVADPEAVAEGAPAQDDAEVEVVPISMIRRTIAENLTRAVREIPHVTTFRTVDCTALEAFRRELGVSPLPIVARALAEVCRGHPMLNASYLADQGEIHVHGKIHIGIATDTERGLVVPVVRDAGSLGISAIADEIARLAVLARDGKLTPADMTGGTITLTNTGSYGSEFGTPIIDPPQGAILSLGLIEPRALVEGSRVVARPACTLSLSFDHRLLDGATAGRAFGDLVAILESRERLEALPR